MIIQLQSQSADSTTRTWPRNQNKSQIVSENEPHLNHDTCCPSDCWKCTENTRVIFFTCSCVVLLDLLRLVGPNETRSVAPNAGTHTKQSVEPNHVARQTRTCCNRTSAAPKPMYEEQISNGM